VRKELALAGLDLESKPSLLVVSRADLSPDPDAVRAALAEGSGSEVSSMAALAGHGVQDVLRRLAALLAPDPDGKSDAPRPSKG
jgi:hypothetical protein